jgi:hypothetical protein
MLSFFRTRRSKHVWPEDKNREAECELLKGLKKDEKLEVDELKNQIKKLDVEKNEILKEHDELASSILLSGGGECSKEESEEMQNAILSLKEKKVSLKHIVQVKEKALRELKEKVTKRSKIFKNHDYLYGSQAKRNERVKDTFFKRTHTHFRENKPKDNPVEEYTIDEVREEIQKLEAKWQDDPDSGLNEKEKQLLLALKEYLRELDSKDDPGEEGHFKGGKTRKSKGKRRKTSQALHRKSFKK